jgi:hypothetical protein
MFSHESLPSLSPPADFKLLDLTKTPSFLSKPSPPLKSYLPQKVFVPASIDEQTLLGCA